jgi:hypothetical protein
MMEFCAASATPLAAVQDFELVHVGFGSKPEWPLIALMSAFANNCGHHEPTLTRLPARPAILKNCRGLRVGSCKNRVRSGRPCFFLSLAEPLPGPVPVISPFLSLMAVAA